MPSSQLDLMIKGTVFFRNVLQRLGLVVSFLSPLVDIEDAVGGVFPTPDRVPFPLAPQKTTMSLFFSRMALGHAYFPMIVSSLRGWGRVAHDLL